MNGEFEITEALLEKIKFLLCGEKLNASECKNEIFQEMTREGFLVQVKNGRGLIYFAPDKKAMQEFLISKDDAFRGLNLSNEKKILRADLARSTGNSKIQKVRSCIGFLVNSYEPIKATLNANSFVIHPVEGTFLFIADIENFKLPENVVVVGVENMENFRYVARQKMIFEELRNSMRKELNLENIQLLFVSRYPQTLDLIKWLTKIPNRYVHFGDLDLAGIHIYLTEFFAKIKERASFFIPQDAEIRIANGSLERYDNQVKRFEKMAVNDKRVESLVALIKKYHKGYDQEGYIE